MTPPLRLIPVVLLGAGCGSPATPPAAPAEPVAVTAPTPSPCAADLRDVGLHLRMPERVTRLLGPDPFLDHARVMASAERGMHWLEWEVSSTTDHGWFADHAAAAIEAMAGVYPDEDGDALADGIVTFSAAWQDGTTAYEVSVAGMPIDADVHTVIYRCGVPETAPMTARDAAAAVDELAIDWIDPLVVDAIGDRPVHKAMTIRQDGARDYLWEVAADASWIDELRATFLAAGFEEGETEIYFGDQPVEHAYFSAPDNRYQVRVGAAPGVADRVDVEYSIEDR